MSDCSFYIKLLGGPPEKILLKGNFQIKHEVVNYPKNSKYSVENSGDKN